MKIEALETFIHQGRRFDAGDRATVDEATGRYLCGNGWAKDLAGVVETAERDTRRSVTLDVHDSAIPTHAEVKSHG